MEHIPAIIVIVLALWLIVKALKVVFKIAGFILLVMAVAWFFPDVKDYVIGFF